MTTTASTFTIRRFHEDDYAAFTALLNSVFTEFMQTEEALRFEDEKRPEKCRHERWIAERDGRIVGYSQYDQMPHIYDPRKFSLDVAVSPDYLQQGIGRALYRTMIESLRQFDPLSVDMWSRADMSCRVQFVANRGFEENFRLWTSELDLLAFDPTRWTRYVDAMTSQGIEVVTREQLGETEDAWRKLFDFQLAVREDVPLPPGETRQPMSYEEWLEHHDHPTRIDEGYFLAVDDGRVVGVSNMWQSPEPSEVRTGLTAVRREYRRRGIAIGLKVRALSWAKAAGYARTVTDNASINRPMLAINERLGFVRKPAWIHYVAQWEAASQGY